MLSCALLQSGSVLLLCETTLWFSSSCTNANISSGLFCESTFECHILEKKKELTLNYDIEISVSVLCCNNESIHGMIVQYHSGGTVDSGVFRHQLCAMKRHLLTVLVPVKYKQSYTSPSPCCGLCLKTHTGRYGW